MEKFTKKYTVIFTQDENGGLHTKRENNGFNAFEILGMLELTKIQVQQIITRQIQIPIENTKVSVIDKERITIDYVILNCDISERLKSALKEYAKYFEVTYLDEVDSELMRKKVRNAGQFTADQLKELKEKLGI